MRGGIFSALLKGVTNKLWGTTLSLPAAEAKQAKFPGHFMAYNPCPFEKRPANLHYDTYNKKWYVNKFDRRPDDDKQWYMEQLEINKDCMETKYTWDKPGLTPKESDDEKKRQWDILDHADKEAEIGRQWDNLSTDQKSLFSNAETDDERRYLLYNQNYRNSFIVDPNVWAKYTPEQKQLFISTVNRDNTQSEFQKRENMFLINETKNVSNEILNDPSMWLKKTEQEKKTYMNQHIFLGHKYNFENKKFHDEWWNEREPEEKETLQSFIASDDILSIQYFSTPNGTHYLKDPTNPNAQSSITHARKWFFID
jgi:hypothetical protein